jgi:serine/threonine protein kinase
MGSEDQELPIFCIDPNDEYDLVIYEAIAKGSFASVHKGALKNKDTKVVHRNIAIKKIGIRLESKSILTLISREATIMKRISHKYVITLFGSEYFKSISEYHLYLEYCDGGTLDDYIKSSTTVKNNDVLYCIQLLLGMQYLHEQGIYHRDIKPANILVCTDSESVKIADFGFARHAAFEDLTMSLCGSPMYMAPEMLKTFHEETGRHHRKYDLELIDIWSIGLVMYVLLTRQHPFSHIRNIPSLKHWFLENTEMPDAMYDQLLTARSLAGLSAGDANSEDGFEIVDGSSLLYFECNERSRHSISIKWEVSDVKELIGGMLKIHVNSRFRWPDIMDIYKRGERRVSGILFNIPRSHSIPVSPATSHRIPRAAKNLNLKAESSSGSTTDVSSYLDRLLSSHSSGSFRSPKSTPPVLVKMNQASTSTSESVFERFGRKLASFLQ